MHAHEKKKSPRPKGLKCRPFYYSYYPILIELLKQVTIFFLFFRLPILFLQLAGSILNDINYHKKFERDIIFLYNQSSIPTEGTYCFYSESLFNILDREPQSNRGLKHWFVVVGVLVPRTLNKEWQSGSRNLLQQMALGALYLVICLGLP